LKAKKKTLLWQIIHPKEDRVSYLFGTMHVKDERAFRGLDYVGECLESCDCFAAEFNLEDANPQLLQEASQLPAGNTLDQLISTRTYEKLEQIVQRHLGQPLVLFNHQSPILLINALAETLFGREQAIPLDALLHQTAKNKDKTLLGLETFEEQMQIFRAISLKDQARSLKQIATNFSSYRKTLKKTAALYIQGELHDLLKCVKKTTGGMRKVLLYDRNVKMANRFAQIAEQQSLFAAIGAGHLAGEKGVLRLLKQRGFLVKPIQY